MSKYKKLINKVHTDEQIPRRRSGDLYIKQLYECAILFFADRFGIENLSEGVMQQLYSWSYSLRLTMNSVYTETINNYAQEGHKRVNKGLHLFSEISEINNAEELKLIVLEQPDIDNKNKEKYKAVYDLLRKWNRSYPNVIH